MKERRYDIDWLRVIAVLVVFVFHCSRFFCTAGWEMKVPASQQSEVLFIVRDLLIGVWNMPLLFLVSGFGTWYSLRRRTGGQYLGERVKRLLVPLYTVGLFILVVPQKYFNGVTNGYITDTFWEWLPSYYRTLPASLVSSWHPLKSPDALLPYTFSGHLWFIQWLFAISLVTLPLLLFLRSERGGRFIDRLAGWVARFHLLCALFCDWLPHRRRRPLYRRRQETWLALPGAVAGVLRGRGRRAHTRVPL